VLEKFFEFFGTPEILLEFFSVFIFIVIFDRNPAEKQVFPGVFGNSRAGRCELAHNSQISKTFLN